MYRATTFFYFLCTQKRVASDYPTTSVSFSLFLGIFASVNHTDAAPTCVVSVDGDKAWLVVRLRRIGVGILFFLLVVIVVGVREEHVSSVVSLQYQVI
jgi:hypothetical protein